MILAERIVRSLLIPKGRAGRNELLFAAAVLFLIQGAMLGMNLSDTGAEGVLQLILGGLLLWMGFVATARRLHDMGWSAWWVPAGFALLCVWSAAVALVAVFLFGLGRMDNNAMGYMILMAVIMMPVLGAALWLHMTPGDPFPNAYGAPVGSQRFVVSDDQIIGEASA